MSSSEHHEDSGTECSGPLETAAIAPRLPEGGILLAATPIGQASDAPASLLEALRSADVVAAEDTRRLQRLARRLGVTLTGDLLSLHEHNEAARTPRLLEGAAGGQRVLLVSDAGMPLVSDPGYRLVQAAVAGGIPLTVLPGPSAVLAALALSGLPTDRFCFEGFLPRRAADRKRRLAELAREPRTMVVFESPRRLAATLQELVTTLDATRPAAVCRELTKTHEEVRRGTLEELVDWATEGVLGEVTLVIAGQRREPPAVGEYVEEVLARSESGERLKDAAGAVATAHGLGKRDLYEAVLAYRNQTGHVQR